MLVGEVAGAGHSGGKAVAAYDTAAAMTTRVAAVAAAVICGGGLEEGLG